MTEAAVQTDPILTTEDIEGPYQVIGIVHGSCVQSGSLIKDAVETVKNWVGCELKQYGEMIDQAVTGALERLKGAAVKVGADAVIGVRLSTANVIDGGAEVIAYGTAVRLARGSNDARGSATR